MTQTAPAQRIAALQSALVEHQADAVFVPSSDPHLSEYLPEHWQARAVFSGFTGSAGTLVVTRTQGAVFADSRYWVQAEHELQGSGLTLVKINSSAPGEVIAWLKQQLKPGNTVLADGQVLGLALRDQLHGELTAAGMQLRTDLDLPGTVWPDRAALPAQPVYEHALAYAVQSRADKLVQVRAAMQQAGASHHVVSSVDDVAWLTNLRGSDVECNPVFLAHVLISANQATLFVGPGKLPQALQDALQNDGWALADYGSFRTQLGALPGDAVVLMDAKRVSHGTRAALPASARVVLQTNPSTHAKARKLPAQAVHIREAMRQDGAAMCEFYAWFEAALARNEPMTELTIDERLSAERAKRPGFVGLSFSTIAAFNANGALPHYRATPESHAVIEGDGLLLIDSGGQYHGGTTDITRVWPVRHTTAAHRRDYTLVLKGTIGLSRTRFPLGTPSPMLDTLSRVHLWQHGLNFGHGTGHGVGYFINVHEGPQSISPTPFTPDHAMHVGMITSIEPGVYREGQWGVRIENLVMNTQVEGLNEGFGEFLEFETLTLCPIDTRLIERELMRADEVDWLNRYHATVRAQLSPLVSGAAREWLVQRTEPI